MHEILTALCQGGLVTVMVGNFSNQASFHGFSWSLSVLDTQRPVKGFMGIISSDQQMAGWACVWLESAIPFTSKNEQPQKALTSHVVLASFQEASIELATSAETCPEG